MSIHSDKSFSIARGKGAAAAFSYERWSALNAMSKRELAELVCHLAALATESYDETIADCDLLLARVTEERDALAAQGMV